MSFLSPIWLLSIAAISIPVFIHLWNVRPGKTFKVGSVALVEASSRKHSLSLKLLGILLLLMRCLLLVVVGLVLAMPYFQNRAGVNKSKGWLLIPKEDFKEAYQRFKSKADSLLKMGYELHYFDLGFERTELSQALADTATIKNETAVSYWSLLQQLDRRALASLPVFLLTPDRLNKFSGNKPNIVLKLQWQTYTPVDSTLSRIERAWLTDSKDLYLVTATSTPMGTYYHGETVNPQALANSGYDLHINNGRAAISLKNASQPPVEIDTSALKIDIFERSDQQDAGYIKAALQTVSQFTRQHIIIKPYSKTNNGRIKKDWLFWLSDQPVDQQIMDNYHNVLVYDSGKTTTVNTWIKTGNAGRQTLSMYKSIVPGTYIGEGIWFDGFGQPALTYEPKEETMLYHFYSRFNPAWNELVWSADFPKIMLQLITPVNNALNDAIYDRRRIDKLQIMPNNIRETNISVSSNKTITDITHYLWLFLAFVFILERWMSYKKSAEAIL